MSGFRAGDRVRCEKPLLHLTRGAEYTVIGDEGPIVSIKNDKGRTVRLYAHRFALVTNNPKCSYAVANTDLSIIDAGRYSDIDKLKEQLVALGRNGQRGKIIRIEEIESFEIEIKRSLKVAE